jgi:hypothetical protein
MSRARRLQARQEKEEADRLRRESAREQRRKEREEKEMNEAQKQESEEKFVVYILFPGQVTDVCSSDIAIDIMGDGMKPRLNGIHSTSSNGVNGSGTTSGTRTPAGDDWELDCEICHRRGINQVSAPLN